MKKEKGIETSLSSPSSLKRGVFVFVWVAAFRRRVSAASTWHRLLSAHIVPRCKCAAVALDVYCDWLSLTSSLSHSPPPSVFEYADCQSERPEMRKSAFYLDVARVQNLSMRRCHRNRRLRRLNAQKCPHLCVPSLHLRCMLQQVVYLLIFNPAEMHQDTSPCGTSRGGVVCSGRDRTISPCTPVHARVLATALPSSYSGSMFARCCHRAAGGRHSNRPTFR